jgi:hypothetical protein
MGCEPIFYGAQTPLSGTRKNGSSGDLAALQRFPERSDDRTLDALDAPACRDDASSTMSFGTDPTIGPQSCIFFVIPHLNTADRRKLCYAAVIRST